MRRLIVPILLLLCATVTGAQEATPKPCAGDTHHEFDFWIGSWDVLNKAGKHVGENQITSHACLLLESWQGDSGSRGMSLNFVDPASGLWTQEWVDGGGGRIAIQGGWSDGAMQLSGTHTLPSGEQRPFRGSWTPLEDGRIRQHFEEKKDKNAEWATWFDGYYTKRKE